MADYKSPLDYSGTKTVKILYVDLTAGGKTLSNSLGDLAKADHRITEEVERNIFIKCIDEDLRLRLENSVLRKQIKDMRLPELVEHIRSFFRQKYNPIIERVRLHRRLQQAGKTLHLYLDALKRIAANCCFAPAEYHSRLRDIFVAGCKRSMKGIIF